MKLKNPVALAGFAALFLLFVCPLQASDWMFASDTMSAGHIGPVSAVLNRGNTVISAGEDGFLEIWSNVVSGSLAVERFQVSAYRIIAMAGRPDRNEVSLVETDGRGLFRVSAWNYRERRNLFRREFRNPIAHISYSMGGSFVMVGGAGAMGLVFLNAANGNTMPSPTGLGGTVALAVTGRTERNMMLYLSSGVISYRDLDSGVETNRFNAPANLSSPVLFGNNRFIAGLSPQGLTVVDAVSGNVVARDPSAPASSLLSSTNDSLYVLINSLELRRQTIDQSGNLATLASFTVRVAAQAVTTMYASDGGITLGTSGGDIVIVGSGGQAQTLAVGTRTRIADATISGETIAFVAENGTWGFIPLDYTELSNGGTIPGGQGGGNYNRVTPFVPGDGSTGQFVFWQNRNVQTHPTIRSANPGTIHTPGLVEVSLRAPLRSVVSLAGKAMFMDSIGNISVVSPLVQDANPFSFSSVGLMDATFVDTNRLILGRSAVVGNTPFMLLDIVTGETVPLPHPAQAGVILQRGKSGEVYAVTVSPQAGGSVTSILQLDPANMAGSRQLVYFQGEHTQFSFAQTPGGIATTVGGEIGTIHPLAGSSPAPTARVARRTGARTATANTVQSLDRTPGFPYRLIEGGRHVISLDRDGNLAWHDGQSGRLLAIFRLQADGWTLQTQQRVIGGAMR